MARSNVAAGPRRRRPLDIVEFIKTNMLLAPAPSLPEILLHAAHPATGLRRLSQLSRKDAEAPPYWAYPWGGGAALARYFLDQPESVAGQRVLDLGAGSGVVGIAAAKSRASQIIAAEIDCNAIAALSLNAAANKVTIEATVARDILGDAPPSVDLVAVGDLFYERDLAERVTAFLDRCLLVGMKVLVGDIGRAHLPRPRLRLIAEYPVKDFGDGENAGLKPGGVFAFLP